jgi:hypothetical protein
MKIINVTKLTMAIADTNASGQDVWDASAIMI